MIKIGSVLQKRGNKWGDDIDQYIVIINIEKNFYYYRYEERFDSDDISMCVHLTSGPWTMSGLEKDFKFIKE